MSFQVDNIFLKSSRLEKVKHKNLAHASLKGVLIIYYEEDMQVQQNNKFS